MSILPNINTITMKFIIAKKVVSICCLSLLCMQDVKTQSGRIDSLKQRLQQGQIDISSIHLYAEIATAYFDKGQFNSSLMYHQLGLSKSIALQNKYWEVKYMLSTAGLYTAATKFDSAELYYARIYPMLQSQNNDTLKTTYYQKKGTLYLHQNN